MAEIRSEHRSQPRPLEYARPLPPPPWQMRFLVIATLVCAGMLLLGMLIHAWRMATLPTAQVQEMQASGATTRPVVAAEDVDWVPVSRTGEPRH